MNFLTQVLHLVGSGAVAFISARSIRDPLTRPNTLAGLQLAESGSVPFLEALRDRAAAEGDDWLAERLARHANDERRHGQIFAQALKQLDKKVIDFKSLPKPTAEKPADDRQRSPFFSAYFEGYSREDLQPENLDWVVFIASTYILELDASKDFVRMANALPEDDSRSASLKKGMLSIAKDETGHAAYLREALERRLSPIAAEAAIDHWRTRKVNAMLAMVTSLVQKGGKLPSLVQDGAPVDLPSQPESQLEPVAVS
ncbi:ferritin-like domain-containing protein [Leptolyngbya sp. FACHB-36]|uniref:ferritin-like domain-containing protein n=1 Tax=Leptolyngbya sp. FACHB-36 TaxID=2692808 RepID=UPI001680018A|nr:ferritin-like domain-containing protein [Leptolyngbya sp. FACHB-36]MBD2021427.1 ferritin-like domain-containing protein [Leptolyngbya sp. FACHB-36]